MKCFCPVVAFVQLIFFALKVLRQFFFVTSLQYVHLRLYIKDVKKKV